MPILLSFAKFGDGTSKEKAISTGGIITGFLFTTLYPVILAFIWIRYFGGKIKNTLIGMGGFMSAIILESIFLSFIVFTIFGDKLKTIYYIIAGICPGLFEETARYLFFIALLKKEKNKNISVSYGIGHGGMESALVGLNMLLILLLKDNIKEDVTFSDCLISCFERLVAVIYHISASVVVFKSVKEKKIYFYIFAIVYHDIVDIFPLLYQIKVITNIFFVEFIFTIFTICISIFSYLLYNKLEDENPVETQPILGNENFETPTENNGIPTENVAVPTTNDGLPTPNDGVQTTNDGIPIDKGEEV